MLTNHKQLRVSVFFSTLYSGLRVDVLFARGLV